MDPPGREPSQPTPQRAIPTEKRKHSPEELVGAKKQRNDTVQLPLSPQGFLKHRTKHQVLYKYNDGEPDAIVSKYNLNEVNFYGPRLDKVGDSYSGVITPTPEATAALAKTILAEVGPVVDGKLVTFTFSVVSEEQYRKSKEAAAAASETNTTPVSRPAASSYTSPPVRPHQNAPVPRSAGFSAGSSHNSSPVRPHQNAPVPRSGGLSTGPSHNSSPSQQNTPVPRSGTGACCRAGGEAWDEPVDRPADPGTGACCCCRAGGEA